jgi:hypothetical protein
MNNKVFKVLYYSVRYELIIILAHYIKSIGINSLYTFSLLVIPVINYLALLWGVIRPLNDDNTIEKKDIFWPFLIITTLVNIIFFYTQQFNTMTVFFVVVTNIVEFLLMKPKKDNIGETTRQNIEDYFKNHSSKN